MTIEQSASASARGRAGIRSDETVGGTNVGSKCGIANAREWPRLMSSDCQTFEFWRAFSDPRGPVRIAARSNKDGVFCVLGAEPNGLRISLLCQRSYAGSNPLESVTYEDDEIFAGRFCQPNGLRRLAQRALWRPGPA